MRKIAIPASIVAIILAAVFLISRDTQEFPAGVPLVEISPSYTAGYYQYIYNPSLTYPSWVKGAKIHYNWMDLEPTTATTTFPIIQTDVASAKAKGLAVGISISTYETDMFGGGGLICDNIAGGQNCWNSTYPVRDGLVIPSDLRDAADEGYYYVKCPVVGTPYSYRRIPMYWNSAYQAKIESFANDLAAYISATGTLEQDIEFIHLPLGIYGESNAARSALWGCMQGPAPEHEYYWYNYVADSTATVDAFVNAFTGTGIRIVAKTTPYYHLRNSRRQISDYAYALDVDLENAAFHNDDSDLLIVGTSSEGLGKIDAVVAYKNAVNYHMEIDELSPYLENVLPGTRQQNEAEADYWNMVSCLDKRCDAYMSRIQPVESLKRLTTENNYVIQMVNELNSKAGKIASTIPEAKVWMRETEWTYMPQCGNLTYYLYASYEATDSAITCAERPPHRISLDGNAEPVFNIADIYKPGTCTSQRGFYDADCDPRYRYARRTNASNPYIYFEVDDEYHYGDDFSATIKVVYLDVGTDDIKIVVRSNGNDATYSRTKGATNQWQTWNFSVANMDVTNEISTLGSTWDFKLWDNGDGVETIHSVAIALTGTNDPTPPPVAPTDTPPPPPVEVRIDGTNSVWKDNWILLRDPDSNRENATTIKLVADTIGTSGPPGYETVKASILLDVSGFDYSGTFVSAYFCGYVTEVSSTNGVRMRLSTRRILRDWVPNQSTWNIYATGSNWQTAGAYGANDVSALYHTVDYLPTLNTVSCVNISNAFNFNADEAQIKLESACPSGTTTCSITVGFGSINHAEISKRPYIIMNYIPAAPTSTPTPTATRTPTRTPTATPGGPADTPTPTPTATPTGNIPAPTPTPTNLAPGNGIKINELCINPTIYDQLPGGGINASDRAVELWNGSTSSKSLTNYVLCGTTNCVLLNGVMGSGRYRVLYQGLEGLVMDPGDSSFVLRDYNTTPYTVVDQVDLAPLFPGKCWARAYDGSPTWVERNFPTLGWGNSIYGTTPTPTPKP